MMIYRLSVRALIFGLLASITLGGGVIVASKESEFSIDETLKNASFNTQHMPTQNSVISKYGEGKTYRRPGSIYHVYYLADLKLWLRCRGESEAQQYVPVSELMISKIDLATKLVPKAPVVDPNLKGIRIGDSVKLAYAQWGEPLRQYTQKLGSLTTKVHEFFPASLGPGLCLRFFTHGDDKIVAFSFSSEE